MIGWKPILLHAALISLATLQFAQESKKSKAELQKGPAFTTAVYTVLVDVIATSKDRHVNDLKPEEFQIFENGARQTIDGIEIQSESGARIIKTSDQRAAAAPFAAQQRANFISFLLDYTTTEYQNQRYVRDGAIKYINEKIGPNDYVAVFATAGGGSLRTLQAFTADKNRLIASLSRGDVSGSSYAGERDLLNSQISSTAQAAGNSPDAASGSSGGSGHTPGSAVSGAASGSAAAAAMIAQRVQNAYLAMRSFTNAMLAYPMFAAIKSIAVAETQIPGRKTLVLFSEGFAVPRNVENAMRDAVDAANKANLAIYTVDTNGLYTKDKHPGTELDSIHANLGRARLAVSGGESLFDRAAQVGSDQADSTLRFLANSTGGFPIVNTNDYEIGLQRVDEDIRSYYILSYRPTNTEFDGKFREIKVDVTRPGVKVRARNGYYAYPPSDSLLLPDQRELFTMARKSKTDPALPLFVKAECFFPEVDAPVAVVTVEVPTEKLKFKESSGGLFDDSLQIIGLVTDEAGNAVTTFGRPLPMQFNKAQLDAVRGGFVTHTESLTIEKGRYAIEVLVHEPASGRYGYYTQPLALDPPEGFKVSDLVISKQVVKAAPEARSDPLVSGDAKILPSASCSFRNGERLIFYFDIYNAKSGDARSNVSVTLSMMRDGKALSIKLPAYTIAQPLKDFPQRIQVSKYLELAGLPGGKYSLKITAQDQNSGNSSSSEAAFTVVN